LRRRLAIGALFVLVLGGCGSSEPHNGLILASKYERNSGALYVLNADGSGLRRLRLPSASGMWTPDGKWIAYNTAKPVTDRSGSYAVDDLWLVHPDGSERHRVAKNVPLGSISPDGRAMAFANDSCAGIPYCNDFVDNSEEIYTIGLDGKGRRRLTHNTWYDGGPSWSPDGRRIVFESDLGIRIMDRDGGNKFVLGPGDGWAAPLWSPRGDRILLSAYSGWAVVSPEGGKLRYRKPGPRGPEWGAAWSPDGRKIVYMAKRARIWTAEEAMQLWVMNADGSGRHPITRTFGWAAPSWAPD
jgi:Tol biopolymer transport system component